MIYIHKHTLIILYNHGYVAIRRYFLDENFTSPKYSLRDLVSKEEESQFWNECMASPDVRRLFEGVPLCEGENSSSDPSKQLFVNSSITEWETRYILQDVANLSRFHWLSRSFDVSEDLIRRAREHARVLETVNEDGGSQHIDACDLKMTIADIKKLIDIDSKDQRDEEKLGKLNALCHYMHHAIDESGRRREDLVTVFPSLSLSSYCYNDSTCQAYLKAWKERVMCLLLDDLKAVIETNERWMTNGDGLGLAGTEADEILHHCKWAAMKCSDFVGREDLINEAMQALEGTEIRCF